mgnify:CR=1 FL=1
MKMKESPTPLKMSLKKSHCPDVFLKRASQLLIFFFGRTIRSSGAQFV